MRSALKVAIPGERHHLELISCQQACPVHTDARGYVRAIAEGRYDEAYLIARGPNPFASICGRICAAPCEAACRRGHIPRTDADGHEYALDRPIAIRALKRFACEKSGVDVRPPEAVLAELRRPLARAVADVDEMAALLRGSLDARIARAHGERIAIVGGGPAGLSAAHDLALLGFSPVVFEVEKVPAGMLAFGIPEYRLPRDLIAREIAVIEALGVEIRCGVQVGREIAFDELRRDFAAVIVAVGAKRPRALGLPGESGPGVYGGVDFLRAVSAGEPVPLGSAVVVIGGGNVAYDVARTVLRQTEYDVSRVAARQAGTRTVTLASLETLEEMPADTVEIREGDEEGVVRLGGWGPVEIRREPDGRVGAVELRRCLRVYDAERKFAPQFDDSERKLIPCDTVLIAAGQATDLAFLGGTVEEFRPGWPKVDPRTLASSAPGVFVAGDLAHGTRLVIDAVASGKRAARSVYEFVMKRPLAPESTTLHLALEHYRREPGYERIPRVELPLLSPEERLHDPRALVEKCLGEAAARREASRCLDCGVTPVFDGARCVLCGGCVDVCPTLCLKIVPLASLEPSPELARIVDAAGAAGGAAILKDEERCIRCALCAMRCPADAIAMERVQLSTEWRTA